MKRRRFRHSLTSLALNEWLELFTYENSSTPFILDRTLIYLFFHKNSGNFRNAINHEKQTSIRKKTLSLLMMRLKCEDHFKIPSILWTFQLFRYGEICVRNAHTCGREHFNSQKMWIPKIECENFIEMKMKCHYLHSICDIINPTFRLDVTDPTLPWPSPLGLAFQKFKIRVGFIVSKMSNTIPNLILEQRHFSHDF